MGDESALRDLAREAIRAGKLPDHRLERVWGGPGSGAPCAVCGKTIGTDEVKIELPFTLDESSGAANCHLHARCFAAWGLERRDEGSNGHALLQGGTGGIMPGRERKRANPGDRG